MAEELKANQRKEWAKLMYLKENITQQEIADRVGVSRVTVNKWAKEWEGLKLNLLQTREERISSTLTQLDELDRSIASKEEGKRFPSAAEADIRRKLTADLEALEQDASIRDIYNVSRGLLDWRTRSGLNTTVHSKGTKPPTTSRRWNEKRSWKSWRRTSSSGSFSFSRNSQSTPLPNSIKRPSNASPRIGNGTRFYRGHVSWQNPPSCSCA